MKELAELDGAPDLLMKIVQSKFSSKLNLHDLENAERELRVRFRNSLNSNAEPRSAFDHAEFGSKRHSERRTRYTGVRHSERRFERRTQS